MSDKPNKGIWEQINSGKIDREKLEKEISEYYQGTFERIEPKGLKTIKIYHSDDYLSFDFITDTKDEKRRIIAKTGIGGFNNLLKLGVFRLDIVYYNGVKYEGDAATRIIDNFTWDKKRWGENFSVIPSYHLNTLKKYLCEDCESQLFTNGSSQFPLMFFFKENAFRIMTNDPTVSLSYEELRKFWKPITE